METLISGLVWGELIARRSRVLERSDRDRVRLRTAALTMGGLPPIVGVADATREVRRIERIRRTPVDPPPKVGGEFQFLAKGQAIAEAFGQLAEEAKTELARVEESLNTAREALAEQRSALAEARKDAKKLTECAKSLEATFEGEGAHT
jgi:hypothetical protein